jgi:hypothetical protein
MNTLSLRRPWTLYKQTAVAQGADMRDLMLSQDAFYSGARVTLKVLNDMLEHGDGEDLHRTLERHGRQVGALGPGPGARRH